MPINVYTGLMRSGKSYEVVSEVILPAVRSGRRIVTNVDGISQELIHLYLKAKYPADDETIYGLIVHVENAQVFDDHFFPFYDDQKGAHTDTLVQPGDLVCIDEAWRFWGATGSKLHKHHQSFFLEHGHFTNEQTNVACDLVLMIQDMSTLNRFVKNVVAFNFRTHKKVSLGMANTYSLQMWEGHKQNKAAQIGSWVRKYKKEIFPLYSSFKGGAKGVMVNADRRQNIFASRKLWFMGFGMLVAAYFSFNGIWKYFHRSQLGKDGKPVVSVSGPVAAVPVTSRPVGPVYSETWRVAGSFYARGQAWVVLTNQAGSVRLASPSEFQNAGLAVVGDIDGAKVTSWSGAARPAVSLGSPSPAAVAAPAPVSVPPLPPLSSEVRK